MDRFDPAVILGRHVSASKTQGKPREQTSLRWRRCPPGRSPTFDGATATFVGIATMAAWLLPISPCAALECPAPQPANAPDAIKETQTQINELAEILASH